LQIEERWCQAQPGAVGQHDVAHRMRLVLDQVEVGAGAECARRRQRGDPGDLIQRDRLDASAGADQRDDRRKGGQGPDQGGAAKGGASDDEAVTVASELRPAAQAGATRLYGFDDTHTGVFRNAEVSTLINKLLDGVR